MVIITRGKMIDFGAKHGAPTTVNSIRYPFFTSVFLDSLCVGTDLNRNADVAWNTEGSSSPNPCSDTYSGSAPFSESELVAWKDWAKYISDNGRFEAYVAIHNWAQMIISSYAVSKVGIQSPFSLLRKVLHFNLF